MEHGSFQDNTQATFSLTDEDHTLANSLRFTLNQDPRVTFCGYSIPHPSDARVNIRVQTTGDSAREVLKDSCQDLMLMCEHVRSTFGQAVTEFKCNNGLSKGNSWISILRPGEPTNVPKVTLSISASPVLFHHLYEMLKSSNADIFLLR